MHFNIISTDSESPAPSQDPPPAERPTTRIYEEQVHYPFDAPEVLVFSRPVFINETNSHLTTTGGEGVSTVDIALLTALFFLRKGDTSHLETDYLNVIGHYDHESHSAQPTFLDCSPYFLTENASADFGPAITRSDPSPIEPSTTQPTEDILERQTVSSRESQDSYLVRRRGGSQTWKGIFLATSFWVERKSSTREPYKWYTRVHTYVPENGATSTPNNQRGIAAEERINDWIGRFYPILAFIDRDVYRVGSFLFFVQHVEDDTRLREFFRSLMVEPMETLVVYPDSFRQELVEGFGDLRRLSRKLFCIRSGTKARTYFPEELRGELALAKGIRKARLCMEKKITYDVEGGRAILHPLNTFFWRAYAVGSAIASMLVAIFNVAGRENWYERLFDGLQTLTFLWVGVFGLLKLANEDPNIIRHTVLGYRVIRDMNELRNFVHVTDRELKLALINIRKDHMDWLSSEEICYAAPRCTGNLRIIGGLMASDAPTEGLLVSERVAIYFKRGKAFKVTDGYIDKRKELTAAELSSLIPEKITENISLDHLQVVERQV
ncbi:hypothetical protein FGB62_17g03 [Gracilaria domingensis]|nr:hypothetical protein FGB62_17g03 [Gracilaria domingensis]